MSSKKFYSLEEAKRRLENYCAYQERCHVEVERKLYEMYLSLEEKLFEELQKKIYLEQLEQKQHRLIRYDPGSLADPTAYDTNWNRSFELKSDSPVAGVLLIHGLGDTALLAGALNDTWKWLEKDLTLVTIPGASHFVQQIRIDDGCGF